GNAGFLLRKNCLRSSSMKTLTLPFAAMLLIAAGSIGTTGCGSGNNGTGGGGGRGAESSSSTGSTGSSNSSSGTGGSGGSGGSCKDASTCPGTDTDCQTRTCTAGHCGFDNAPAGPAAKQTPGDCKKSVCDGMGMLTV